MCVTLPLEFQGIVPHPGSMQEYYRDQLQLHLGTSVRVCCWLKPTNRKGKEKRNSHSTVEKRIKASNQYWCCCCVGDVAMCGMIEFESNVGTNIKANIVVDLPST